MQSLQVNMVGHFNEYLLDCFIKRIATVLKIFKMNRDPSDKELSTLRIILKDFSYLRRFYNGSPLNTARARGRFIILLSDKEYHKAC